jgi:hypothetical protein
LISNRTEDRVLGGGALKILWDWIQNNSSGLSVVLSLLGFLVLWWQTKKARNAAEAARMASAKAAQAISTTATISDLATIRSELKIVQVALRGERFETALLQAQSLRERLDQLRSRVGFDADETGIQIQGMVTFLKKLHDQLENKCGNAESVLAVRQSTSSYPTS